MRWSTVQWLELVAASSVVLVMGCSSDETNSTPTGGSGGAAGTTAHAGTGGAAGAAGAAGAGGAAPEGIIGGVQVRDTVVDSPSGGTMPLLWVWGIYDRPFPGQIFGVVAEMMWEVTLAEGDCVYLEEFVPGFCEPACDPSTEYCTPDGRCETYPVVRDAGIMTLTGLDETYTFTPNEFGYYVVEPDATYPLLVPGAHVTLRAQGGPTPAFTVSTDAVAPLEPAIPCTIDLDSGSVDITWTPTTGSGRVRWEMISAYHAGDGPMVLCETDDSAGSLTVPAALVEAYAQDRTPRETYQLSRYQLATTEVEPSRRAALEVSSTRICFH